MGQRDDRRLARKKQEMRRQKRRKKKKRQQPKDHLTWRMVCIREPEPGMQETSPYRY